RHGGERSQKDADVLFVVELLGAVAGRALCEHGVAAIRLNRRIRLDAAEQRIGARRVASLLEQLALASAQRLLTRIDEPTRNFERHFLRAEAVLLDKHYFFVGSDGDDVDP